MTHKLRSRIAAGLLACLATAPAVGWSAVCLVSDPLNHTGDAPIAGTVTTAEASAPEATVLDTRSSLCAEFGDWVLSLLKKGLIVIFR